MKMIGMMLMVGVALSSSLALAGSDVLDRTESVVAGANPEERFMKAMGDLKGVLQKFRPHFQKGTTLISGPSVSGSTAHPVLKMTIEKCVIMICKTVKLDAEISMRENSGSCDRNVTIEADLVRSGSPLTDVYSDVLINICYKNESATQGRLKITVNAVRAGSYQKGMLQEAVTKSLAVQLHSLVNALDTYLKN